MIDPHVHLRDWSQSRKETVRHGLATARKAGLDGIFEMPNTDPPLISRRIIQRRLDLADSAGVPIFHGIYAGLTPDPSQIEEMVRAHRDLFPRVVGLKMFAGKSTGNLAIVEEERQREVLRHLTRLGYSGVLAVHCEKESLMNAGLWDPEAPLSHTLARPPEAERESIRDILGFCREAGFGGTLHVCHVSVASAIELIRREKDRSAIRVTCGVTPHHLLLSQERLIGRAGLFLKVNPPLRSEENRRALLKSLYDGQIDWIETDHAPHTLEEKLTGGDRCPSGMPGLPVYPLLIRWLRQQGMEESALQRVTHKSIESTFGIRIDPAGTPVGTPAGTPERLDLAGEYDYDPYDRFPFQEHPMS